MVQSIYNFDWSVFQFFENHIWNSVLDVIMSVITRLGDGGLIWIASAICLLIPKKTRKAGIVVAVGLILSLLFTDVVLKPIFERVRPFNYTKWPEAFKYPDLVPKPHDWSFPSGHTSSSFAAAVPMLIMLKKRIGIPAVVLASLIGFSRIYIHVHYCSDVIGGLIVGIIYGVGAYMIVQYLVPWVVKKVKELKAKKAKV